jgi:excisionase family DNA binding protein
MFSVEIKFRAGDREVSLEKFATLFLTELLQSAQDEMRRQPTPMMPPVAVAAPARTRTEEQEPRAVGLKQAARLLGVSEHTVRAHVRQGKIPSVRFGRRVLIPTKAINDLTATRA